MFYQICIFFAINDSVTSAGMEVTIKTSSNLFIEDGVTFSEDAFAMSYTSTMKGILLPASSIDGENFFKTENDKVENDGSTTGKYVLADTPAADADEDDEVYYRTYSVYLKAVNANDTAIKIDLTQLQLVYQPNATESDDVNKAMRVAVIVNESDNAGAKDGTNLFKVVYSNGTAADYFTSGKAVKQASAESGQADADKDTVSNLNGEISIEVAAKSTAYFYVTISLWLEGEDKSCTTDNFKTILGDYTLDLKFELDTNNSKDSVSALTLA